MKSTDTSKNVGREDTEEESALIYLPNGLIAVRLPQITTNPAERLIVLRWYVNEGEEVGPGQLIVRVATMHDRIDMPMPPMSGRYRIAQINKQPEDLLSMGEVFVTLQILDNKTTFSKPMKASYAA